MKKLSLIILGYLLINHCFGQGFVGPSPDALSLIRQASVGVNLYSGTPQIGIPLADLSGRELAVSASLSYNSAGNRVQDIASSEGLGWFLSAGGMISRVVRGLPDDLTNGFCTSNRSDTEPDLFVFNFSGRYGRFVLDAYGNPAIYPFQDLIIKPGICKSTAQTWEIVDENGTRYQFGATTNSRETTTSRPATGGTSTSYVTTWYLNKIISPNNTDEITLSYSTASISYVNYFYTKDDNCTADANLKNHSTQISLSLRYLSSITSSGGYMYFTWNNSREDITGAKSLNNIRVTNRLGHQIKKIRFEYSYFQTTGCSTEQCKRLRLDKIYDLSSSPLFTFQYNTTVNLPARNSKHFDHWGYYNSNTVDSWIPADNAIGLSGASRNPDATKMQANILNRISQRGGSYQKFTYEANTGIKDAQTHTVSGVRIKNIETADGKGNIYTKNYTYTKSGSTETSGLLFRRPSYSVYVMSSNTIITIRRFSHAYSEILDLNGVSVGYSRIEETTTPANGKVIHTYTNYDTNPDLTSGGTAGADSPPFASVGSLFWERGNPIRVSVYNQANQLLSEEVFEYTFNHANKKQVTGSKTLTVPYSGCGSTGSVSVSSSYIIYSRPFTLKKTTSIVYDQTDVNKKITRVSDYSYDPVTFQPISTTLYNAALPAEKYISKNKFITHADYRYDPSAACSEQLTFCEQQCTTRECLDDCYNDYTYCMDTPPSDPRVLTLSIMHECHMQNVLVEEQKFVEINGVTRFLGGRLNLFNRNPQNTNMMVLGSSLLSAKVTGTYTGSHVSTQGTFVIPASFKTVQTYNTYDATSGKLLQETSRDGIQTQYVWDHNNTLIKSSTLVGGAIQFTTNYEYKPLVGPTRAQDPNGLSVYTEYDGLGRPRLTKDSDGNIVERNRYHYAGELPGFLINASKQQAIVNESITFSVADLFVSTGGSTSLSWNMGDGRVYNDNRQSFSLSYAAAGTYTVTLTLSSNEYAPVSRSIAIKIGNPLQISVCVDGPQEIDLCQNDPVYYGNCTNLNNSPYSNTDLKANIVLGTGCTGSYTYKWEYKNSTATYWSSMGTTQTVTFPARSQVGSYTVKCTVTDACNSTAIGQSWINIYQSDPNCGTMYLQTVGTESEVSKVVATPIPMPNGKLSGTFIQINDK